MIEWIGEVMGHLTVGYVKAEIPGYISYYTWGYCEGLPGWNILFTTRGTHYLWAPTQLRTPSLGDALVRIQHGK